MSSDDKQFAISVGDDIIADVMTEYFNKSMFKKKVEVVDMDATESGYKFMLRYVRGEVTSTPSNWSVNPDLLKEDRYNTSVIREVNALFTSDIPQKRTQRGSNGRFVKKGA